MKYLFLVILSFNVFSYDSTQKPLINQKQLIINQFKKDSKNTLKNLITVVNNEKSSDEWHWLAISSMARLTGGKSIPLLKKYSQHKNWNIRLAALKSLIALKYKEPKVYAAFLKDKSMIVRMAALEAIEKLKINKLIPNIWNMFLDKRNYVQTEKKWLRSEILSQAIHSLGQFKSEKVKLRLFKLLKGAHYEDLWDEIDEVFTQWSGQKARGSNILSKRSFWLSKQNIL